MNQTLSQALNQDESLAARDGRDDSPITIRCLERFYHKSGTSVAISIAINEDLVFLPLTEIIIEFTGLIESEKRVIEVTMPMWLATYKRLA